jgi:hypothetical protein
MAFSTFNCQVCHRLLSNKSGYVCCQDGLCRAVVPAFLIDRDFDPRQIKAFRERASLDNGAREGSRE